MAAGLGFKTFNTGDVLSAADVNGYLMQGVLVFADATARDAAITSPQEGQFAYTKDNNSLWYYSGSAWVASGATGDIEGVTAGVGISGGGTSGTVTVTNSMATAIDAKGDLVVGTGADTFSKLTVGANGTTLVADSAETTGLKWVTASGGGKLKQVVQATTTAFFSTNSTSYVDITGLSISITPTANTSKIFAIWNSPTIYRGGGTNANNVGIKLVRGATDVFANDYLFNLAISGDKDGSYPYTMFFLDSPATTSATTYKLQMKNQNSYTSYWNYLGSATEVASITLFEIGA
jgi:hypothetical protein